MSFLSLIRKKILKRTNKDKLQVVDEVEEQVADSSISAIVDAQDVVAEDQSNSIVTRSTGLIIKYLNDQEFHDMLEVRRGRRRKLSERAQKIVDEGGKVSIEHPNFPGVEEVIAEYAKKKVEYDLQAEVTDEDARMQLIGEELERVLTKMKRQITMAQKVVKNRYNNPTVKKMIKGMRIQVPKQEIYASLKEIADTIENR